MRLKLAAVLGFLVLGGCRTMTSNDYMRLHKDVAMLIPCDKDNCGKSPNVPN